MLKINETIGLTKVCDIILNDNSNTKDKVSSFWGIKWCDSVSKETLIDSTGRCYFIVVNGDIHKIGFSESKGGIKSTIGSYRSCGNSGSPSIRTYGIHILITEELLKMNNVEVWVLFSPKSLIKCPLMDGSEIDVEISSGKTIEKSNVELFKLKNGRYPKWNMQEDNEKWSDYIVEGHNNLRIHKIPTTIKQIKNRLDI